MAKNKNPLYVVSEKSGVVEEAMSRIDYWVKKLGLTPLMNFLKEAINQLLEIVNNFQMFVIVKAYIDELLEKVIGLLKTVTA